MPALSQYLLPAFFMQARHDENIIEKNSALAHDET